MRFRDASVRGAILIEVEPVEDRRGSFVRLYSREDFATAGLRVEYDYCAISQSSAAGTLRGLHFQVAPHGEAKLVWCVRGSVFDVIVDLRPSSPSYRRWFSTQLRPQGPLLFIPPGVAHGFQTLEDDTVLQYHVAGTYRADAESGVRWDDPSLAIAWPIRPPTVISDRDAALPVL